jgi:hypothetical protein
MKKWIDFVKIKFHSNENIKWHCMQIKLNWNWIEIQIIQFKNNWIKFKYIELGFQFK